MRKIYPIILIFGFLKCSTWDNVEGYQPPPELTTSEITTSEITTTEFPPLPNIQINT